MKNRIVQTESMLHRRSTNFTNKSIIRRSCAMALGLSLMSTAPVVNAVSLLATKTDLTQLDSSSAMLAANEDSSNAVFLSQNTQLGQIAS